MLGCRGTTPGGLLHSGIRGSTGARPSPRLIAAYHALPRPVAPRHPPLALDTLAPRRQPPCPTLGGAGAARRPSRGPPERRTPPEAPPGGPRRHPSSSANVLPAAPRRGGGRSAYQVRARLSNAGRIRKMMPGTAQTGHVLSGARASCPPRTARFGGISATWRHGAGRTQPGGQDARAPHLPDTYPCKPPVSSLASSARIQRVA